MTGAMNQDYSDWHARNRQKWESLFRKKIDAASYNKYPIEHIVIFMARNYYAVKERSSVRVLELGCGSGNNLVFLAREGFKAYGVDFSPSALELSKRHLDMFGYTADLRQSCISELPFEDGSFDAVIESNTLHCNMAATIAKSFGEIFRVLKPGGKFYGIMASDRCAEVSMGKPIETNTVCLTGVKTLRGQFDDFPLLHFFSKEEIIKLTQNFTGRSLELDLTTRENDDGNPYPIGYWLMQLVK